MDISLKNLLLAGIGSMAYSYEKGNEIVENLIKKGEITVKQGMELNEELKHNKLNKDNAEELNQDIMIEKFKDMLSSMNIATKEDIDELKKRISKLEE